MSEPTRVVHCKRALFDIYIGRAVGDLECSKWHNPYRVAHHATREQAITRYEDWISTQPELLAALPELKGKVLGCWCHPLRCHGDVLALLADDYKPGDQVLVPLWAAEPRTGEIISIRGGYAVVHFKRNTSRLKAYEMRHA
jgi:hypothetical protein